MTSAPEQIERPALDRQPHLGGELVEVRPLRAEDYDALWSVASDPLVWEQHPAKERATPDGFALWFVQAVASEGALTVIDRGTGAVIGSSRYDHLEADSVEIGWTFLARSRWGGTYNADLKRIMIDHALAGVGTVVFRVHIDNHRSQRAVAKLGARRVGDEVDPTGRGVNLIFHLTAADRTAYGAATPDTRLRPDQPS